MSKPRIYAGCKAGCLWETVHKSDFTDAMDLMGTHLEAKPEEDGKLYLELGKIYKIYAPKNTDSTAFDSELYVGYKMTNTGEICYARPHQGDISDLTFVSFPATGYACDDYFTIQIADYRRNGGTVYVFVRVNGSKGEEYEVSQAISIDKELLTENALYLTNVTRVLVVNNDVSLPYSDEALKELQEEVKALAGQNEYIGSYTGTDYTENTIQSVLSNFVKSVENREARDGDIINIVSAGADVDYSGQQWIFSDGIFKYYIDFENHSVIDNLNSDSAIDGLSARMGKLLNQEMSGISNALSGCIGDVEKVQESVNKKADTYKRVVVDTFTTTEEAVVDKKYYSYPAKGMFLDVEIPAGSFAQGNGLPIILRSGDTGNWIGYARLAPSDVSKNYKGHIRCSEVNGAWVTEYWDDSANSAKMGASAQETPSTPPTYEYSRRFLTNSAVPVGVKFTVTLLLPLDYEEA